MTDATGEGRRFVSARAVLLTLTLLGLLFTSAYPLRGYFDIRRDIAELEQEERALDQQTVELEARREELTTDAEVERLARQRLGMVRPGETAFFATRPQAAEEVLPPVAEPAPAGSDAPESLIDRWLDALARAYRLG